MFIGVNLSLKTLVFLVDSRVSIPLNPPGCRGTLSISGSPFLKGGEGGRDLIVKQRSVTGFEVKLIVMNNVVSVQNG
jgi:hypothetical protein